MPKVCPSCGETLDDQARFCRMCGLNVSWAQPSSGVPGTQEPTYQSQESKIQETEYKEQKIQEPAYREQEPEYRIPDSADVAQAVATGVFDKKPQTPSEIEHPAAASKNNSAGILILAAALVVILAVCCGMAARHFISGANSPQSVSDAFLTAMEQGDYDALMKVAYSDSLELSEELIKPVFALYKSSLGFRREVQNQLGGDVSRISRKEQPENDGVFMLEETSSGLFGKRYKVLITPMEIQVVTNIESADITLGGSTVKPKPAAVVFDFPGSGYYSDEYHKTGAEYTAAFANMLPGIYTVTGVYESTMGETFRAETEAELYSGKADSCTLDFTYAKMLLENSSGTDCVIYIGGREILTLPDGGSLSLQPVSESAEVRVESKGEIVAVTTAQIGYLNLEPAGTIESPYGGYGFGNGESGTGGCALDLYSAYGLYLDVYVDGAFWDTLYPWEYVELYRLETGAVVEVISRDYPDVFETWTWTVENGYDYAYVKMSLTSGDYSLVIGNIADHILEATDAFGRGDLDYLYQMPDTMVTYIYITGIEEMEYDESDVDGDLSFYISEIYVAGEYDIYTEYYSDLEVDVYVMYIMGASEYGGEDEFSEPIELCFEVLYDEGNWSVYDAFMSWGEYCDYIQIY